MRIGSSPRESNITDKEFAGGKDVLRRQVLVAKLT